MALGSMAQKSNDVILIFSFILILSESPETAEVIKGDFAEAPSILKRWNSCNIVFAYVMLSHLM